MAEGSNAAFDDELAEVIGEFLMESREGLDRMEQEFVELEQRADDADLLASVFRTMHTIKGTCGFLGFGELEAVAHAAENVLSRLREGKLFLSTDVLSALLASVDAARELIERVESTGSDAGASHAELVSVLRAVHEESAAPTVVLARPVVADQPERDMTVVRGGRRLGELLVEAGAVSETKVRAALGAQAAGDKRRLGEILVDWGAITIDDIARLVEHVANSAPAANAPDDHDDEPVIGAPARAEEPSRARPPEARAESARSDALRTDSVRVDLGRLDAMVDLVGELVLARNELRDLVSGESDARMKRVANRLGSLTSELQERLLGTRMQPVGVVLSKLPRVVRDLSLQLGKQVRVVIEGEETELDRALVDAVRDPLTHLVRNAVDHGLETPDARAALGKPVEGLLIVRARHEGGQVVVEITDDGAGIDVDRVRAKAIEKGVLTADEVARMSDVQAVQLICEAGFSTAAQVTNLSGRGVGMDVVKTNIEAIGGSLEIDTQRGFGTTFRLRVPLTRAIMAALIVRVGAERFALPSSEVRELVRLGVHRQVEWVSDTAVLRFRGRLLPLVWLRDLLGLPATDAPTKVGYVVVLQFGQRCLGVVVDGMERAEEIVVKPLSPMLRGTPGLTGSTILADGSVVCLLDPAGLRRLSNLEGSEVGRAEESGRADESEAPVVVCRIGEHRCAVPLPRVERFEKVAPDALSSLGDETLARYRGGLLRVVAVSRALGLAEPTPTPRSRLLVCRLPHHGEVGLLVDEIHTVTTISTADVRPSSLPGISGSVVVADCTTALLDLDALDAGLPLEGALA